MKSKLTAAERKLNATMLAALEHAHTFPSTWHDIGKDKTGKAAVEALRARGVVEVNEVSNQFRLKREGK